MNDRTDAELDGIVAKFSTLVQDLTRSAAGIGDEASAAALEQRVRDDGRAILVELLQTLLNHAVAEQTQAARTAGIEHAGEAVFVTDAAITAGRCGRSSG